MQVIAIRWMPDAHSHDQERQPASKKTMSMRDEFWGNDQRLQLLGGSSRSKLPMGLHGSTRVTANKMKHRGCGDVRPRRSGMRAGRHHNRSRGSSHPLAYKS
jgi:hypothetical protein